MKVVHQRPLPPDDLPEQSSGAYSERTAGFLPGILEGSDDLFAAIDSELRLVAFNAAFRRVILGMSGVAPQVETALGESLAGLPTLVDTAIELCRRTLAGEDFRLPLDFVDQAGQHRFFDATFSPIRDPAGAAVAVTLTMRDVTDKRLAELRFQAMLGATPDAMLVVRDGKIEFASPLTERMFGYPADSLRGRSLECLIPQRLRERHALQRIGFERHPKTRPMGVGLDLCGLKADGSEFPVEISLSPIELNDDRLVIAAIRDISARKHAEEEQRRETAALRNELAMLQRRQEVPSNLGVYRAGFEHAAAALLHYAPDGRIRRVNNYFCKLLGYRREELVQTTIAKLTHPDDVELNTDMDLKLLAGALDDYQVDKRLLRRDGKPLWVRLAVSLERDALGQPDFLIAVAEAITERKQAEEALREARQRLAMTAEIACIGYAEVDFATRDTYLSPELKRQLGHDDAEIPNTFGEWVRRLHPDDRDRATTLMHQAIDEPRRELALEFRLLHKDGTWRWFSGRGVALEDVPGQASKLLFTQIDITGRKVAEQRLLDQTEELSLALRVGRSGTFQWDAQTHEHRWYDAMFALYGLQREEFGGRDEDWLACLLPEDRAAAMAAVDASLKCGEYVADFRIRRHDDGTIRWISARGQVFFDADGTPRRMVGINVDVTEERRIRSELEASKALLRAVLDSLDEGVVVFDPEGHIVDTNPAALEHMGCSHTEHAHRRVGEFSEDFELFSLDGRRLSVDEWPLNRVLRGESLSNEELVMHRKVDGANQIVSYNGAPIRDVKGGIDFGVLTVVDVTERKQYERALQESERRLALALEASNTAVWELDVVTQDIHASDDRLFAMLGYASGELGTPAEWIARIHEDDRPGVVRMLDDVIQGKCDGYQGTELRYRDHDGRWHWILCQAVVADRDGQGRATRLIGTHTDIHARKQAEECAREAALHDALTGLPNRALVYDYGARLLAAARRNHGRGALLFVDLDRFKPINDQHGHEAGDRVLQEVGKRLVDCTRQEDLVGRLGGDEFVILLANLEGEFHRATVVAQHVVEALSRPFRIDALEVSISPSIGISLFPDQADCVERLIHAADLAMYQVKQSGRANYLIYTPDLDRKADQIHVLEVRLRDALRHGGLALHYQPVIDVRSGELVSAEALVRLDDDRGDSGGPANFIPVAESTGLIGELGEWVAAEACRQQQAWQREGLSVAIAINVSPLQFRQRDFPERLGRIIAQAGINPRSLQLEITETTVMECDDTAATILNRIKALGVKLALDDFGTGYSSLNRLTRLPFDKLKVDQSFVNGITNDPASRAVTEAIIALGRNLRLDVIGEGIESEDTLHYLREQGCDQAQGYWFSQPLPAAQFAGWYRQRYAVH